MTPETSVFALTVVLGFVHILVCDVIQTRIHGVREMVGGTRLIPACRQCLSWSSAKG